MGSRRKGRILAFQAIFSWEFNRANLQELCLFPWLDPEKREAYGEDTLTFAKYLLLGTIENLETVDTAIKNHLENWDFQRLSKVDLAIIRMSAYSLLFQKDIPANVTIDEAIDISKEYSAEDSYKFVNGVLDGINRDLVKK